MTGGEHAYDSQDLYFNHGKPTKNPKLVPYGVIEQKKGKKPAGLKRALFKGRRSKR
jgi:hypothetical protein